jgi:hypothetical protein
MASDAQLYNSGLDVIGGGSFVADTYRCLLTDSYTYDATDVYVADTTPGTNELSGAGYSRPTLASKSRTVASNLITFDCTDPGFGSITAGETATAMILYKFVTNDAASPLVAHYPMSKATNGSAFTVVISASGLIVVRNAP